MHGEERAIHIVLVLIGGPIVALDVLNGGELGGRATIALLMLIAGTGALIRTWLRPPDLPPARALRRRA